MRNPGLYFRLLIGLVVTAIGIHAEIYLGMERQALVWELGRPTSTLSRPGREILIFPNGARITLENGKVVEVEGMEYAMGPPEEGERPRQPEPAPEGGGIPSFPSSPDSIPRDLQLTEAEQAGLRMQEAEIAEEAAARAELAATESVPITDTWEGWDDYEPSAPGIGSVLIGYGISMVITLIILKIAVNITGVSAFIPGLLAIAVIDTGIKALVEWIWGSAALPFLGPVVTLSSFIAMLYLVKGFTSATQWPTIIRVVVMTKVVAAIAAWVMIMAGLNLLG